MLNAAAEQVLRANWREGVRRDGTPFAFTCPSPRRYKHQWYWDSCFHAIGWSHIDPARARAELRTLLRAGRPDGFVPHTAFWQASARWRRAPLYATASVYGATMTQSIQTPLLAVAWERVAAASPDAPGFLAEGLAPLAAHARWLCRARWDAHLLAASTDEHVEDVLVNVAHALSLRALGRMSGESGWAVLAERTETALLERCWDEKRGLFFDLAGRDERRAEVSTWSSLAPLALGAAIPREIRERLADEHLLNPRRYGARFGVPSVSMEEPSFRPGFNAFRTWRGAAWVNTAWLMIGGLRALGAGDEADTLARGVAAAAERSGLREYYHPRTGEGHGEHRFGFSTLLLDLPAGFCPAGAGVANPA